MSASVHYEIYVKKNRNCGWELYQACEDRKEAVETAKAQRTSDAISVRVTKESFDERNEVFRSVSIFSDGPEKHQRQMRENNRMDPPCRNPLDLYTLHARRTLARALGPWLKRQAVSVMELLHRPDLAEQLAAAGHDRQHAIQKVAIAQAGSQECSVQHLVRSLTELADKATDRLRMLDKSKSLPGFDGKGFARTHEICAKHKEPEFAIRHALAQAMAPFSKWEKKFVFLAACVSDALVEGAGGDDALHMLDEFISETAALPHAINELCRGQEMGARLDEITDLLLGKARKDQKEGMRLLAEAIASKRLPITQSVLAARVFNELCGPRRLFPDDFPQEVELNRSLADRLIQVDKSLAPVDRLQEAFVIRSSRLLSQDAISNLLSTCRKNVGEEFHALLQLEESIVGEANKAKLAAYLRAIVGAHKTRTWFSACEAKTMERLGRLAHAQRQVQASGLAPEDRAELSEQIDRLCFGVLEDTNIIDAVLKRDPDPVNGAMALTRMCDKGVLTIGVCSEHVCRKALSLLKSRSVRQKVANGDERTIARAREIGRVMESLRARA